MVIVLKLRKNSKRKTTLFLVYPADLRVREVAKLKLCYIDSEHGTNLRYIQELLGHQNSKTTEIYTHVTEKSVMNIQSPLDKIMKVVR